MKSGGIVFDERERKADRWRAQYEHWLASATTERNNRREGGKKKETGREKQASVAMKPNLLSCANNAPFPPHSKYSSSVL